MKRSTVVEIISSLLVLLFVYSALSKLFDYSTFKLQLSKSPYITDFAFLIAWALPVVELLIAVLLFFNRTRLAALYGSLFLMTMFTAYIYSMLNFSYYIPCSCGGVLSKMTWGQHLWFNIFFVAISITGILLQVRLKTQPRPVVDTASTELTYSQLARL